MDRLKINKSMGAKNMSNIICTSECVNCKYCTLDDSDRANIRVKCQIKQKEYIYGQKIPCDNYKKK